MNLTVSVKRCIYHCFSCGVGGPLPDAAKDIAKAIFIDLHESRYPPSLTITLPAINGVKARRDFLAKILSTIPPNIAPFIECGEVVEMSPACVYIRFPPHGHLALERCMKEGNLLKIAHVCSQIMGREVAVHLSLQEVHDV
jgi:hypothetical protein